MVSQISPSECPTFSRLRSAASELTHEGQQVDPDRLAHRAQIETAVAPLDLAHEGLVDLQAHCQGCLGERRSLSDLAKPMAEALVVRADDQLARNCEPTAAIPSPKLAENFRDGGLHARLARYDLLRRLPGSAGQTVAVAVVKC